MSRNWVIAPYFFGDPETFAQAWNYDRNNNVIVIGYDVGDLSGLSSEEIQRRYTRKYPDKPTRAILNQVIRFWCEIQPGDRVIARGGRKKIMGVGTVIGLPFYDPQEGQKRADGLDGYYESFLPVQWEGGEKEFDDQVFSMHTLYELPDDRFEELTGTREILNPSYAGSRTVGSSLENGVDEEDAAGNPSEFELEKYLQEFIVSNFDAVFHGELSLFADEGNRTGQQYLTDVGRIDILARDAKTNAYVVIELKKGKSSDVVIGQTLRYMGWVQEHLCGSGDTVRGLIICHRNDDKLDYAQSMVPNIDVKYYKINFQLTDTPNV